MSRILDRLVGLETEYAFRVQPFDPTLPRPSRYRIYEQVIGAVKRRLPTATARHFKEGVFLANGAAVWFEAERPSAGGGLIEGATPECRGPREVLVYQRAQDRLLAQAARDSGFSGRIDLIKNDCDGKGNVYGAQENYETAFATGLGLLLWRAGLVLLFPVAMLTWLGLLGCVVATLSYFAAAGLICLIVFVFTGRRQSLALFLLGRDLVEGRETCVHVPVWLEFALQAITRLVTAPLAAGLFALLYCTAFRHVRRQLIPFLVTRPIWAGAGWVDSEGRFQLSDKGPSINCVFSFGGMFADRPIFTMGHFFKAVYAEAWFSPRDYFGLFASRQRLQIGLGDSNMCEVAEYLRVGTTLLVLDAIEAGMCQDGLVLRRPIHALHTVCRDTSLRTPLELREKRSLTALQVQRYYWKVCRTFLAQQDDVPAEARNVLNLWGEVLDGLQELARRGTPPSFLIGSLDWVTKKSLLDQVAANATWQDRKKIDIRYHELSPEGYFELLQAAGGTARLVAAEDVARATRTAPPDSPATTRGHFIREFAQGGESLYVNWKSVTIGTGWGAKIIRLARYGRGGSRQRSSRNAQPRFLDKEP